MRDICTTELRQPAVFASAAELHLLHGWTTLGSSQLTRRPSPDHSAGPGGVGEIFTISAIWRSLLETADHPEYLYVLLGPRLRRFALLVGGIGVDEQSCWLNVTERTREIGIRVATGATYRHSSAARFIVEALVAPAIGWPRSVFGGLGFAAGLQAYGQPIQFTPAVMLALVCAFRHA